MKAVCYNRNGGPAVLEYRDLPDPVPADDQVLIRVKAISIEGGDLLNRTHVPPAVTPFVGGYQVAGIIEATGSAVTTCAVGQRVVAFNWSGSHAELMATSANYVYPIPDHLDFVAASVIPVAFGTAHDSLFEFGGLKPGETVLVQGAAGGVGLAAVQLAKAAGAVVIGTSSSDARLDRLKNFGMDHGINYATQDVGEATRALTGGAGADLILDMAGGKTIQTLMRAARYRARIAIIGAASGDLTTFGFFDIIRKSLTVYGISFGREMHTARAHQLIDLLIQQIASGTLRMPIDRTFPLSEAAAAHSYAETGHPFGRVILLP